MRSDRYRLMPPKVTPDGEHGVWPPAPESEPTENDVEPHGLPQFLSRLSVFAAALSIGCIVYDFVISELFRDDNQYFMRTFMDDHLLPSCYVQLCLASISAACSAGSRTITVSKIDNCIRVAAILFMCFGVLLMITRLTMPREK
jgi:hypothetical protein